MMKKYFVSAAIAGVVALGVGGAKAHGAASTPAQNGAALTSVPNDLISFDLKRSAAIKGAGCLLTASGKAVVKSFGEVEVMSIDVQGLPANTEFDLFVIQVPNSPFGLSWYQGDMETNYQGRAHGTFIGRFNEETFIVAPGVDVAPVVHNNAFPDASDNPATAPVHTFHVGLWFNSPDDASKAGCPASVTPFNGEHNAGIQVLSTNQFGKTNGPLRHLKP
jgi:hypothetical protein